MSSWYQAGAFTPSSVRASIQLIAIIAVSCFAIATSSAQTTFTSLQSGNWNDGTTWDQGSAPGSTDHVVIADGHLVKLQANQTIDDFTINSGGNFDYNGYTLTVDGAVTPFVSVQTGDYDTNSTWLNPNSDGSPGASDRVIIIKGHTVTANNDDADDLTISAGAVLNTDNNRDMTVVSNLVVNGTIVLSSPGDDLEISGTATMSGSGTIDGSGSSNGALQVLGSTTIESGSLLTFMGDIDISAATTLTIDGSIRVTDNAGATTSAGDITGAASSAVTMGANGELEIDGVLLSSGTLNANATGNTIEYNGPTQTIKQAASSYYNLRSSGTGTRTFPGSAMSIDGDLDVTGGTLDVNSQNINIGGDWINAATVSNLALVTFDGSGAQEITSGGVNFVNLTVNKSSGEITLVDDLTVTGTLALTDGIVNTGSNSLQLGSGAEGTLTPGGAGWVVGTFGRYIATGTTTAQTFPVGTSTDARTAVLTFGDTGAGRSAGSVLVNFTASNPGSIASPPLADDVNLYNPFNEGFWDVSLNGFSLGGGSNSYSVQLTGDGFSSFGIDANTRIMTRTDAGSAWTADGAHGTVSANDVSRTGVTTLAAQFAFGDDTNCTPPADPVISGTTDLCASAVGEAYNVTPNVGNDLSWTVVGGTIVGYGTSTGFVTNLNSITIDWGATGQIGSVSVQERNGCTTSNVVTQAVQINSIPPSNLTGNVFVPEGATGIVYSVDNEANTTYNWTITGGTPSGSGNSITVDWGSSGAGKVSVTATKTSPSCSASTATELDVTVYVVVNSNGTGGGAWDNAATWETGTIPLTTESARIQSGDAVTMPNANTEVNNLIINGTLTLDNNRNVDVTGDLVINSGGLLTSAGGVVIMSGTATSPSHSIDGTGDLGNVTINITNADKHVASTAVIGSAGTNAINIAAGLTVTNNGSLHLAGNASGDCLTGDGEWVNSQNSTLTFGGNPIAAAAAGSLVATASGNTVAYNIAGGGSVISPTGGYQNVEIDGDATLSGSIDVNGNFTLTSGTLTMASFGMTIAGDMTYVAGSIATPGTITLDGSTTQTISGFSSLTNLTINNTLDGADAITVANDLDISGTLTLTDGIVGLGANTLTITNTATGAISGGSTASFVNGTLARQTASTSMYDYPVGDGTTYKRVGLLPQNGTASTFVVQGAQSAHSDVTNMIGLANVSTLEHWNISRTVGADNVIIRLYWNTRAASGITSAGDLLVGHYTGGQWTNAGNGLSSGDVDPGWIETGTYITTFSPFTFASNSGSSNPLPVEFVSFEGVWRDGAVLLEWETATEINNERFDIERSADGYDFEVIGAVAGSGDSHELRSYQFLDKRPLPGTSYYRLRQVDFDGASEYSAVLRMDGELSRASLGVRIEKAGVGYDELRFRLETQDYNSPVHLTLWDSYGREVFGGSADYLSSSGTVILNGSVIRKTGLYFLRVQQGINEVVIKFVAH